MLGVITTYCNYSGNPWMYRNYCEFRQQMSDIPFFTVELSFTSNFKTNAVLKLEAGDEHYLCQKSRLLNLLVERLPVEIDSLAWVDSNIFFLNPDWYQQAEHALGEHSVVQLLSGAHWLNKERAIEQKILSGGYWPRYPRPHCGHAWAMRRESWEKIDGLFDLDIMGGSDVWMAHAFYDEKSGKFLEQAPRTILESFAKYSEKCNQVIQGRVGKIRGDILHMFQGDLRERLFWTGHQLMKHCRYCPLTDVITDTKGLIQWTGRNQKLESQARKLLELRVN